MKKTFLILFFMNSILLDASAQNWRVWATYFGGSDADLAYNTTVDASGNVYLTGQTYSASGIATPGAHQNTYGGGGGDAFLIKYNSSGVRLWATYYGGPGSDYGLSVKTDAAGNVYMAGYTSSTSGIATAGTYQTSLSGAVDAFVVKFNSAGVRQWATYYGDTAYDQGSAVAADASGNVYLTGFTESPNGFATAGAQQMTFGGEDDAFLVKFNNTGNRLWGTFYGGGSKDYGNDVAIDSSGNVIICGYCGSTDSIASAGGFQNSFGGDVDAFVAKFNPAGSRLWATYYGGTQVDFGIGVATGPGGVIYLTGQTSDTVAIASGGFQNTFGGARDAYLVKFDAAGNRMWATYYGGAGNEEGIDVAVDAAGFVFLGGDTYSSNAGNCVATPGGFQTNIGGTENNFLVAFTPAGVRLSATYYGSTHEEEAHVAVSSYGEAYLAGFTYSPTGISYLGFQNTYGGGTYDAYLVKFTTPVPDTGINVPNNLLPPNPTSTGPIIYIGVSIFDGGNIHLTDAVLKNFSPGTPLPSSGSSTIVLSCDFTGTYSDGGTSVPVACQANVRMKVDFSSSSGPTKVYDTEMLQLDLYGGTLPSGVTLRESPTLVSHGQTVITDIGSGQFRMSSFFDVFTELSTDNGNSWQPASGPPSRIAIRQSSTASIPALSEWGLILFGILVLGFGMFYIKMKVSS
ncbi:MAG: IPTL-CTERM sorting domain-containing protein [Bacteroidetes bacterium]|nr:IPTL-CTERM sorting domain-containing protein [Bacteroidota bacterium]